MAPHRSAPDLLCLHAARLLGYADEPAIAARFALDRDEVAEHLLDFQAFGWVSRSAFGGTRGWSLTDRGRAANEEQLARELDASGARPVVLGAHREFLPLNTKFQEAASRWQLRPMPGEPMASNDHSDPGWDDRVIESLVSIGRQMRPLCERLAHQLLRFDGYAERYSAASSRVDGGARKWVDGLGIESCHVVWMQLHEDLLATLGLDRAAES